MFDYLIDVLTISVVANKTEMVKFLLKRGLDPNTLATERAFIEGLGLLTDEQLMIWCSKRLTQILGLIVDEKNNVSKAFDSLTQNIPLLYIACILGHVEIVKILLEKADKTLKCTAEANPFREIPLIAVAIAANDLELMEVFINAGVDLTEKFSFKGFTHTPLTFAIGMSHFAPEPMKLLIGKMLTEISSFLVKCPVPLCAAILLDNTSVAIQLIQSGVDPNEIIPQGEYQEQTPLQLAIDKQNSKAVDTLVNYHVNVNQVIKKKDRLMLPLDFAVEEIGKQDIINFLKKAGALHYADTQFIPNELEVAEKWMMDLRIKAEYTPEFFPSVATIAKLSVDSIKALENECHTLSMQLHTIELIEAKDRENLDNILLHCKEIIKTLHKLIKYQESSVKPLIQKILYYDLLTYELLRLSISINIYETSNPIAENIRLMQRHLHFRLEMNNLAEFSQVVVSDVVKDIVEQLTVKLQINFLFARTQKNVIYNSLLNRLKATALGVPTALEYKKIIYFQLLSCKFLMAPINLKNKVQFYGDHIEAMKMQICRMGECYSNLNKLPAYVLEEKLDLYLQDLRILGNIIAHEGEKLPSKTDATLVEISPFVVFDLLQNVKSHISALREDIPELKVAKTKELAMA